MIWTYFGVSIALQGALLFESMFGRWVGITWWRHQMESLSVLLALCVGNLPVPVNSPHKGQWRGALMFSLICVLINGWVNSREAGDMRCHRGHYDVNVMTKICVWCAYPKLFPMKYCICWCTFWTLQRHHIRPYLGWNPASGDHCFDSGLTAHFTDSFSVVIQIQWKFNCDISKFYCMDSYKMLHIQGSFCISAHPMRDDVTL